MRLRDLIYYSVFTYIKSSLVYSNKIQLRGGTNNDWDESKNSRITGDFLLRCLSFCTLMILPIFRDDLGCPLSEDRTPPNPHISKTTSGRMIIGMTVVRLVEVVQRVQAMAGTYRVLPPPTFSPIQQTLNLPKLTSSNFEQINTSFSLTSL